MEQNIHRGDIFWVDHPHDSVGSEIKKVRPAVVVSNEKNNLFSSNIEICYLTTAEKKKPLPTHVEILLIGKRNTVLCENVYTISKDRLGNYIATLDRDEQSLVDRALLISLGLPSLENFPQTQKSVQSVQQPENAEELKSVKKRCIELQAQNQLYHKLLSSFVPNFGGTAPC